MKKVNLIPGEKYGMLTSIGESRKSKQGTYWTFKCECGEIRDTLAYRVISGEVVSCGCVQVKDISGNRYGYLTAIKYIDSNKHGRANWLFACDCGKEKIIAAATVLHGGTKSCGCKRGEWRRKFQENEVYLRDLWRRIKSRCYYSGNIGWKYYGGRGIKMFDKWTNNSRGFADYILKELGHRPSEKHSIDRIDFNKGYEPGNLRWADAVMQSRNRRGVKNK